MTRPKGPLITLDDAERKRLLQARKAAGITQDKLGKAVGTTAGTISNIETGRAHGDSKIPGQVRRGLYAKILRYLKLEQKDGEGEGEDVDELFNEIIDAISDMTTNELAIVMGVIRTLRGNRPSDAPQSGSKRRR